MGRISQRSKKRAEKEFNIYFKSMEREHIKKGDRLKTPTEFTFWLVKEYGEVFMDELRIKANSTKKWTTYEKEDLLEVLKEKIRKHETNLHG